MLYDDAQGDAITPEGLAKIAAANPDSLPVLDKAQRIGPCVGRVGKFICVGLNYADHAAETNMPIPAGSYVWLVVISSGDGTTELSVALES